VRTYRCVLPGRRSYCGSPRLRLLPGQTASRHARQYRGVRSYTDRSGLRTAPPSCVVPLPNGSSILDVCRAIDRHGARPMPTVAPEAKTREARRRSLSSVVFHDDRDILCQRSAHRGLNRTPGAAVIIGAALVRGIGQDQRVPRILRRTPPPDVAGDHRRAILKPDASEVLADHRDGLPVRLDERRAAITTRERLDAERAA